MSCRILVVDDDEVIASCLQAYLEDEGMEVQIVGSAEEALAVARGGCAFDVCVMDMRLPGLDGDAAIRTLHHLRPALRFVMHTGSSTYTIPDDLRAMGIDEGQLFRKPLSDMGPLATMVRALAEGQPG
jgi:CheY-like chemotaxis protein